MDRSLRIWLLLCALSSLLVSSSAQTCQSYSFSNNNQYASCSDLSSLGSFIHWSYNNNGTLDIAYRQPEFSTSNWIAWAINVNRTGMLGADSLVAYVNSTGPYAYTSHVDSYGTQLESGSLSFPVPKLEAENSNGEMIIYATLELPTTLTNIHQVWQEGPLNSAGTPASHATSGSNLLSMGNLDLLSGQTTTGGSSTSSRLRRRNVSHSRLKTNPCFQRTLCSGQGHNNLFHDLYFGFYIYGISESNSDGINLSDSWCVECCQLGDFDAYRCHDCKICKGFPGRRPSMVLPSCCLPVIRIHSGCGWMGNWYKTWQ